MTKTVAYCPHCGSLLEPSGKPRSLVQHRRYFALMNALFLHWPATHERQFASAEEMRAFLQMKAGYRETAAVIPIAGMNRDKTLMLVEAGIRAAGSYAIPVLHGANLVIFRPKSIAFGKLSHLAFCDLNNAVDVVIREETGLDPDVLLKESERAA